MALARGSEVLLGELDGLDDRVLVVLAGEGGVAGGGGLDALGVPADDAALVEEDRVGQVPLGRGGLVDLDAVALLAGRAGGGVVAGGGASGGGGENVGRGVEELIAGAGSEGGRSVRG